MPTVLYATRASYPVNGKENPISLEEFRAYVESDDSFEWWDEILQLPDYPEEQLKLCAVFEARKEGGAPLKITHGSPGHCLTFELNRHLKIGKEKILEVAKHFDAQIFRDVSVSKSNKPLTTIQELKN